MGLTGRVGGGGRPSSSGTGPSRPGRVCGPSCLVWSGSVAVASWGVGGASLASSPLVTVRPSLVDASFWVGRARESVGCLGAYSGPRIVHPKRVLIVYGSPTIWSQMVKDRRALRQSSPIRSATSIFLTGYSTSPLRCGQVSASSSVATLS